jgi:hypothetical protein
METKAERSRLLRLEFAQARLSRLLRRFDAARARGDIIMAASLLAEAKGVRADVTDIEEEPA